MGVGVRSGTVYLKTVEETGSSLQKLIIAQLVEHTNANSNVPCSIQGNQIDCRVVIK